jgi:tryptophan synthase alpha chain
MRPIEQLESTLRASGDRPALVAYLTAGWPSMATFPDLLRAVAEQVDAVELGIPFSDPMADGPTIQRTSKQALEAGVTLEWILQMVAALDPRPAAPILFMSYLNPLISFGLQPLARRAAAAGVCGFIIPDLPLEECEPVRTALEDVGLGLVQLVTPVTPPERRDRIAAAASGFVYAVTATGITGGEAELPDDLQAALCATRAAAKVPVLAGFGIRSADQVARLAPHADGVIVGTALLDCIAAGNDPVAFLRALRPDMEECA